MEPDEIRTEIERKKKRAKDLRLRETLWALHYYHLSRYKEATVKDPQLIYPEIRQALKFSEKSVEFTIGTTEYKLLYKEEPTSEAGIEGWGSARDLPEVKTVPATLSLTTNGQCVFEFKMSRTTTYERDGVYFSEQMREVTSFIEGPWVAEVTILLPRIKAHEKDLWDERQAPELAAKLAAERKRFGL